MRLCVNPLWCPLPFFPSVFRQLPRVLVTTCFGTATCAVPASSVSRLSFSVAPLYCVHLCVCAVARVIVVECVPLLSPIPHPRLSAPLLLPHARLRARMCMWLPMRVCMQTVTWRRSLLHTDTHAWREAALERRVGSGQGSRSRGVWRVPMHPGCRVLLAAMGTRWSRPLAHICGGPVPVRSMAPPEFSCHCTPLPCLDLSGSVPGSPFVSALDASSWPRRW